MATWTCLLKSSITFTIKINLICMYLVKISMEDNLMNQNTNMI